MWLKLAAVVILLHGLIHLIGVIAFWKLGMRDQYSTKILGGAFDIGERGTYILGAIWLVVTVAYVVVAYGMFTDQDGWRTWLAGVTALSLAVTVLGWKETVFGTIFNVIVLAALLVG